MSSQTAIGLGDGVYETWYQRSLRHYLTREALPKEEHYKNLQELQYGEARPSLDYLHENGATILQAEKGAEENEEGAEAPKLRGKVVKFGWMEGVLMPCLLNIWGVMLFLRLSWVAGQAGIILGSVTIILGNSITVITTMSMSAVATNGQIKAGGIYYMISRSLGPEFGGSIGLMFTTANSIGAATYIIGFVNSLQDMCADYFSMPEIIPGSGGGTNDVRILGTITLIGVLIPAIVGMDWVNRVQKILLFLLIASQINFVVGAFMGPQSDTEAAQGFIGFNGPLSVVNLTPDYRYFQEEQSFFTVFGVFFPAVTGIVAGANLSGDLKDPGNAIPKGTLLAVLVTFLTYFLFPIMVCSAVVRHATGNVTEYLAFKDEVENVLDNPALNGSSCGYYETGQSMCKYGTHNNFQIIELMAAWGPLIYIGCFAATLSSAIASLVGAPRVLQALAKDNLYPYIHVFAVGFGANNDPFRGYILVCVISFACVMLGELNAVSSLLTNCFLASYGFINFSCFHASYAHSPGWRPAYKYYNMWLSLIGAVLCLICMFLIDWPTALITIIILVFLFGYVVYKKPNVNWGSSTQAQSYNSALKTSLDLVAVEEHVKNYRPQLLLLCGNPWVRPTLVDFGNLLTKGTSLLNCTNIVEGPLKNKNRHTMMKVTYAWFAKHKIKSFYTLMEARDLEEATKTLVQTVGLGKLCPNTIFLGYKTNWRVCPRRELKSYFNTMHETLNMHFGLVVLRVQRGFDFSGVLIDELAEPPIPNGTDSLDAAGIDASNMNSPDSQDLDGPLGSKYEVNKKDKEKKEKEKEKKEELFLGADGKSLTKNILNDLAIFQNKFKGTIDVWWLYDDGGLTVLMPYIIATKRQFAGCKLRVFVLANRTEELEMEQRSMISLLSKFRIDFSDIIIIPEMAKKASEETQFNFSNVIERFRKQSETEENEGLYISDSELLTNKEKTNRHLRLRELLLENSRAAALIAMTMPIPRKNSVSASLYMAWLEILSKDMPPFLFIRGNQTSVLTYYS